MQNETENINFDTFPLRNIDEIHIEVTPHCNLNCNYCYAEPIKNSEKTLFSLDLFKKSIEIIANSTQKNNIEIIFHGGEPLLHSIEWFNSVCFSANEILRKVNKTVSFGLQSNLTLLNNDYIEIFKKYNVLIGTSIDGTEQIHNNARGGYSKTIENIEKLKDANIFSGAIAVIYHHNWNLVQNIYETFDSLNVKHFSTNIASTVGNAKNSDALTAEQILNFYIKNYEQIIKYAGKTFDGRLIEKIKRHINKISKDDFLSQLRCDTPFCHAGITMLFVKCNGDIFPCGSSGSTGHITNFVLGNLKRNTLNSDSYYSKLMEFHKKTQKYENECSKCKAIYICEHGCPAFDLIDLHTTENKCIANKKFQKYLDKQPIEILQKVVSFLNLEN